MKIEKGMYVRTKYGIAKVLKESYMNEYIEEPCLLIDKELEKGFITGKDQFLCDKSDVIDTSYDIIDLIEVGDYVNGELVEDITGEYLRINGQSHNKYYLSKQIKSIVTKEQFESVMYKVK